MFRKPSNTPRTGSTPVKPDVSFPSAMALEIVEIKLKHLPSKASYIRIRTDHKGDVGIQSVRLTPNVSFSLTGTVFGSSTLAARPSSYLLVDALSDLGSTVITSLRIPIVDAIMVSQLASEGSRKIRSKSVEVDVKVAILEHPRPRAFQTIPDIRVKTNFSDEFSRESSELLVYYLRFQSLYKDRLSSLPKQFIYPALSVFSDVVERLGSVKKDPVTAVGNGGQGVSLASVADKTSNPLRDILRQTSDLLASLINDRYIIPPGHQTLLNEVVLEICRTVSTLEGSIYQYRDQTWESAVLNGYNGYYSKPLERLFLLRFKTALLIRKGRSCSDTIDRYHVVQELLGYALEEDKVRARDGALVERPFTAVLASPRGTESEFVWLDLVKILGKADNIQMRDICRRAMLRLIQASDRLPQDLLVPIKEFNPTVRGVGSFGTVYRGETTRGSTIAIKAHHGLVVRVDDDFARKQVYREIVSWKTLKHPNVLPFLGVQSVQSVGYMCLISPWMSHGTLKDACKDPIASETRLKYMAAIVEGMTYLHNEGLAHGDLRAANVFLGDGGEIQIADFGLSVFTDGFSKNYFSLRTGNLRWIAPELMAPKRYNAAAEDPDIKLEESGLVVTARPTKAGDVYSFACVCIELYGYIPFAGIADADIRDVVPRPQKLRPSRPSSMPNDIWGIVVSCWRDEATERPQFHKIRSLLFRMKSR